MPSKRSPSKAKRSPSKTKRSPSKKRGSPKPKGEKRSHHAKTLNDSISAPVLALPEKVLDQAAETAVQAVVVPLNVATSAVGALTSLVLPTETPHQTVRGSFFDALKELIELPATAVADAVGDVESVLSRKKEKKARPTRGQI